MVAVSTLAYGSLDALLDDEEDIVQHGRGQLIRLHTVQLDRLGIIIKKFFKLLNRPQVTGTSNACWVQTKKRIRTYCFEVSN